MRACLAAVIVVWAAGPASAKDKDKAPKPKSSKKDKSTAAGGTTINNGAILIIDTPPETVGVLQINTGSNVNANGPLVISNPAGAGILIMGGGDLNNGQTFIGPINATTTTLALGPQINTGPMPISGGGTVSNPILESGTPVTMATTNFSDDLMLEMPSYSLATIPTDIMPDGSFIVIGTSVVPEPAATAVLGLCGLLAIRRRRNSRRVAARRL
jgi:MYXO-CTERM domain-containing protein